MLATVSCRCLEVVVKATCVEQEHKLECDARSCTHTYVLLLQGTSKISRCGVVLFSIRRCRSGTRAFCFASPLFLPPEVHAPLRDRHLLSLLPTSSIFLVPQLPPPLSLLPLVRSRGIDDTLSAWAESRPSLCRSEATAPARR